MHFDRIWVLWGLLGLIPLLFLFWRSWYSFHKFQQTKGFSYFSINARFPSWFRRYAIGSLKMLGIALVIIGLAKPYIFVPSLENEYKDVRLIFLTDVSRSMAYAEDIKPNRLEAAKKEIKDFYNSLDGFYQTSIIPFSGMPNTFYCPLTYSKSTFMTMLNELDWRVSPALGTNLNNAFDAVNEYVKFEKIDKSGINLIILLSDGGREEALATNQIKLLENIRKLSAKNFRVYVVGIGGPKPAQLIVRDVDGNFLEYIEDEKGGIAYSLLDEDILVRIADAGKGKYVNFKNREDLYVFLHKVIADNRISGNEVEVYDKVYLQSYLFAISAILLIASLISNRI